jgi:ADP-ribosyl-[dinitrogen reductase] hydrolase
MLGAIVGDVVGSTREFHPIETKVFELLVDDSHLTDDTVLTIAVGMAIAGGLDLAATLRDYSTRHVVSYGMAYWAWVRDPLMGPYSSWSNGASMRVSSTAWLASDTREVLRLAHWSAQPTHDHPEAVRGAEAVALAIHLARAGWSPPRIREAITRLSGYDLSGSVDDLRATAEFECRTWISVPRAIVCALRSTCFEDAIRNAVSLGGDADTEAAIAGAIAEPLHGIDAALAEAIVRRLPEDLRADLRALRAKSVPAMVDPTILAALPAWDPGCVRRWQSRFDAPAPPAVFVEEAPAEARGGGWFRRLRGLLGNSSTEDDRVPTIPPEAQAAREALATFVRVARSYGCREMAVREAARQVLRTGTPSAQISALLAAVAALEEAEGRDPMPVLSLDEGAIPQAVRDLRRGIADYADTEMLDLKALLTEAALRLGSARSRQSQRARSGSCNPTRGSASDST